MRSLEQKVIKIKNKRQDLDETSSDLAQLDSFFLHVKNLENDEQSLGQSEKMNVWAIKDHTKMNLLDAVLKNKSSMKKTIAVI